MKALASSSWSKIGFGRNGDTGFYSNRRDISFAPSKKLTNVWFLHLICLERKPLPPIRASTPPSLSPQSQTELEVAQTKNQESDQSKTVHVKIQLNKECSFGEQFVVVGDDPIFGMWDPENAIPLNWSDGHVWILELDIPIGQTIQFKFILKEITGKISWQPGPDRVLKTWETNNTIVVCEDWEDATFQKLLEEEPNCNQNEEPTDNSEMLIVAENLTIVSENLTVQNEEFVANVNNGAVTANVTSLSAKEPLSSDHEKSFITEDLSSSQEKNIAIVDDNSGNSKADPAVSSSHQKLGEKIINHETDGNEALAEEMLGRNGKAPICENSVGTDIEENLINHVGEPVLVPGLPPLSVDSSEPEIQDEDERSSSFVASVGAVEVEDRNPPELVEKRDTEDEPHGIEMTEVFSNEEQVLNKLEQKPLPDDENQHELNPVEDNVAQTDIRWGRRTIQKLLTNLGFL